MTNNQQDAKKEQKEKSQQTLSRADDKDKKRKKISLWCAKFCKKSKDRTIDVKKSKVKFFDHRKKKYKQIKESKGTPSESGSSVSTLQTVDSFDATVQKNGKKRRKKSDEEVETSIKDSKRRKQEEEEKSFGTEIPDFTKSCCYMCAENTLAIAAAISSKVEKFDVRIQVSTHQLFKDTSTSDKNFRLALQGGTAQSSVKAKTRERGTLCPSVTQTKETKSKKKRTKFRLFPKLKRTKCPAMRTVACETDRMGRNDCRRKYDSVKDDRYCKRTH